METVLETSVPPRAVETRQTHPKRVIAASFAIGYTVLLGPYVTQGILPALGNTFRVSESVAALSLSVTTLFIALSLIPMGILAAKVGGTRLILLGALVASVLAVTFPWAPNFEALLVMRAVQGIALASMPASILGMLAERLTGPNIAKGVGAYLAGSSLGGLSSRVFTGVLADSLGWQWAATLIGVLIVIGAIVILALLKDEPRHAPTATAGAEQEARPRGIKGFLTNQLWRYYLIGALCMVIFGGSYTMLGTRLEVAPFFLSQSLVGAFFLIYLTGTLVSSQYGRIHRLLGAQWSTVIGAILAIIGVALTLPNNIPLIIIGFILITGGFFTGHLSASHSVSTTPSPQPSITSAIYLTCYYTGASIGASSAAGMYQALSWPGVAMLSAAAMIAVVLLALAAPKLPRALRRETTTPAE